MDGLSYSITHTLNTNTSSQSYHEKTTWSGENERLQALLNDVEGGRAALGKDKGRLQEEFWGMTDRESALSADMKALESTHTAAIAALRKDHDKDQASLKSTHAEAVLALEASHAVLVDSLRLETGDRPPNRLPHEYATPNPMNGHPSTCSTQID